MLNWNSTKDETWWWVSDKSMMLNHTDVDGGTYDSIERTWMSYYTYEDERFIDGIKSCWTKINRTNWFSKLFFGKYYYQGERYPHRRHRHPPARGRRYPGGRAGHQRAAAA